MRAWQHLTFSVQLSRLPTLIIDSVSQSYIESKNKTKTNATSLEHAVAPSKRELWENAKCACSFGTNLTGTGMSQGKLRAHAVQRSGWSLLPLTAAKGLDHIG